MLSIRSRLLLTSTLSMLAFLILAIYSVTAFRQNLYESAQGRLKDLVSSAETIITSYEQQARDGKLPADQARARAIEAVRAMRYDTSGYFWIHDMDMRVIMHPMRPEWDGQIKSDIKTVEGKPLYGEMNQAIRTAGGTEAFYAYGWPKPGEAKDKNFPKESFVKLFKPWNMVVGTGVYIDDIDARAWSVGLVLGAICLIVLAALSALVLMLDRSISRPLAAASELLDRLNAGDAKATADLKTSVPEINGIVRAIEGYRQSIIEREQMASRSSADVKVREARQVRIDALIAEFRRDAAAALDRVGANARSMVGTASDLNTTADTTANRVTGAAAAAEQASASVEQAAAAAEELASSIQEIARQIATTNKVIERASDTARSANTQITGLADAASRIGDVVDLINNISCQTNLLALNATIEAARAGEAGRGFAVVASEVKSLASQTAKATEDISAQISGIQTSTGDAVAAIRQITDIMEEVNHYTAAIAAAVDEQGAATGSISRNVSEASTGTRQVADAMSVVAQGVGETTRSAASVLQASNEVTERTSGLNGVVDNFLKGVTAA
jgi:methyl-accepting chemotaxis protein